MEIIAHRGASAYALENSRASIALARRLGADRIELDIRVTADEVLLVLHDERLERTTTATGLVRERKYAELTGARLKNGEELLTFQDALSITADIPLYLDVKAEEALEPLVWTLRRHPNVEVIVSSKSDSFLRAFHKKQPALPLSLQLKEPDPHAVERALSVKATLIHPCWENDPDPVGVLKKSLEDFRRAGLGVVVWREDDPHRLREVKALGDPIRGVTTSRPDIARSILKEGLHGAFPPSPR